MSILIKNVRIVNADKISDRPLDILIENGTITKIGEKLSAGSYKILDAKGQYAFPGLIDLHCHLREPGREDKETIETGSRSAAKGGFTTVMCMPNTNPVIDNGMIVEGIIKEARRVGLVNVIPIGAITKGQKGEELSDIFELKTAGCLALSDDGKSVANSQLMRLAMEYSKMANILLIEHCEDPHASAKGVMNESYTSTILGLRGQAGLAESIIVARDIELAHYLSTRIHFAHMSMKRSIELIRTAKKQGIKVTAEACPHHFTLTDEAVKSFDTNTKINPPLRSKEDLEAIKEGLRDGTIDCISTDHAPHTHEEKELEFDHAPFGMIGFETAVGLVMMGLFHAKILTLPQIAEKMSAQPACIVGLKRKGVIKEGNDGDITIIDPDKEWIFRKEDIASKSKNSPFIGKTLKGRVEATVLSGRVTYQTKEN